jgi:hypothetical protein
MRTATKVAQFWGISAAPERTREPEARRRCLGQSPDGARPWTGQALCRVHREMDANLIGKQRRVA